MLHINLISFYTNFFIKICFNIGWSSIFNFYIKFFIKTNSEIALSAST